MLQDSQHVTGANQLGYLSLVKRLDPDKRLKIENEVERRVADAIAEEERAIEIRRQRIIKLRTHEEEQLQSNQKPVQDDTEVMRRKVLEIELQRSKERKEFVDQKRIQQKFLNCEPIRRVLSKKQEEAIKRDQWWQIKEKLKLSAQKQQEDEFYQNIMLQNVQHAMKLEEENRIKSWEKKLEVKRGYFTQIEEKLKMKKLNLHERDEEKLRIEQEQAKAKELEAIGKRERLRKIEALDAEMKEMIANERAVRQARLLEEKGMADEIDFLACSHKGLDKKAFKRETDSYMESLKELVDRRREEERQFDDRLAELIREREHKQNREKKKLEEARIELARSVLRGRQEQLVHKKEMERRDAEMSAREKQQLFSEAHGLSQLIVDEKLREAEKKRRYAEELRAQMNERKERTVKEKLDELREKEALAAERAKLEEELKDLTVNPPDWHNHPLLPVKCATHYIPPA